MSKDSLPGAFGRGLRLGKLGLGLTGSYLGYQAQNLIFSAKEREQRQRHFQTRASRQVREELGSLKGAAMKLGQLLSLQTRSLPEEALEELAQLQMRAPAMHPTLARAQFKAAMGKYPEQVFAEFDLEPFAAASLGQVHHAVTRDGENVAVKIQYPAIRSAIENDFKLLRSATLPARVSGHLPREVLDEVQRGFLEETDYLHEAANIEFFTEGLRPLSHINVPRVHRKLTTDRVLTMSFVEGEPAASFLKQKIPTKVRDLLGERLLELYYFQLHRLRALHADHHPGNYLFRPDGSIGLVDFGCVKRINFDVSELIRSCACHAWRKGEAEAERVLSLVLGRRVPFARSRRLLSALEKMAGLLFPQDHCVGKTVDFGKADLPDAFAGALKRAVREKLTNPEFAFISRAELGLISLLHRLGAKVSPTAVWGRLDVDRPPVGTQ